MYGFDIAHIGIFSYMFDQILQTLTLTIFIMGINIKWSVIHGCKFMRSYRFVLSQTLQGLLRCVKKCISVTTPDWM